MIIGISEVDYVAVWVLTWKSLWNSRRLIQMLTSLSRLVELNQEVHDVLTRPPQELVYLMEKF